MAHAKAFANTIDGIEEAVEQQAREQKLNHEEYEELKDEPEYDDGGSRRVDVSRSGKALFVHGLKEKHRINKENLKEQEQEQEQFRVSVVEASNALKVELHTEFTTYFEKAKIIVKETDNMQEEQTLAKLGLEETDNFDGNFGFNNIKRGEEICDDVSHMFHPRNKPPKRFRDETDEITCDCCIPSSRKKKIAVNYDPMSDAQYEHYQRRFIGVAKRIDEYDYVKHTNLNFSKAFLADTLAMKLLSEFIFRNPLVTSFNAEGAKGFDKEIGLPVIQALHKTADCLRIVNMANTHACPEVCSALALVGKISTAIESVNLSNCSIEDVGAAFWGLALSTGCEKLTVLNLSKGKIHVNGAIALAIGLSQHPGLRVLNLSGNRVDRLGCQRIGQALLLSPCLEELDLSGNAIGSRGAASIAAFLIHPKCSLKKLDISDNDIGRRGGKALSVGLSENKSIVELYMGRNDVESIGAAGFGICLEKNSSLRILDLSNCDLDDIGCAAIAFGLRSNSTLETLILSDQALSDMGAVEIGNCLKLAGEKSGLKSLQLQRNAIRNIGANGLAAMLKVNKSLIELRVDDNEITNEGAAALGLVLENNENITLQILVVSGNPIEEEIAETIFVRAEHGHAKSGNKLDIVAGYTEIASNNLNGFGVVFMRTKMKSLYTIAIMILSLFTGWFNFASNVYVCYNQARIAYNGDGIDIAYAVLVCSFVVIPFLYVIIMFSVPENEMDATLGTMPVSFYDGNGGSVSVKKKKKESFYHRFRRITRSKCDENRAWIFFVTLFQARISWENYLSYKQDLTTVSLMSIKMAMAIFASVPQSLIQLHILLSSKTITNIDTAGLQNESSAILLISIILSVSVLSSTLAIIFEEKFIFLWKQVGWVYEDEMQYFGLFLAWIYHFSHYTYRALTIALVATLYAPLLAIFFLGVSISSRLFIHNITKSHRRKLFAVISTLVGVASWDTRLGSRLGHLFELVETIVVIAPLWEPSIDNALAFQQKNWDTLAKIVSPQFFTGILITAWGISFLLYVCFIERIHHYSDVVIDFDVAEAEALARAPFKSYTKQLKEERRKTLGMASRSVHSVIQRSSSPESRFRFDFFRSRKHYKDQSKSNALVVSLEGQQDEDLESQFQQEDLEAQLQHEDLKAQLQHEDLEAKLQHGDLEASEGQVINVHD
jgi:Ran GTPase-activating protein (RanGAP) involved in mRNA processing and transport